MINKWILDNFKSIDKEKNLEFRPLTIFTGANSSGKSTVLQSILLLTQTLQNQIHSRSIVLNGSIKRFGSYDDVVYRRDCTKDIKIGFSLKRDPKKRSHRYAPWEEEVSEVDCQFTITTDGKTDCLQPSLRRLQLCASDTTKKRNPILIEKSFGSNEKVNDILRHGDMQVSASDLEYQLSTEAKPRVVLSNRSFSPEILGVGLFHFLPHYVLTYQSIIPEYRKLIPKLVDGKEQVMLSEVINRTDLPEAFIQKAREIVEEIQQRGWIEEGKENSFMVANERLQNDFSMRILSLLFRLVRLEKVQKKEYTKALQEAINGGPELYSIDRIPASFYYPGIELVKDYFANRIKYLGPLREEPRSLYPINSMGSTDVGLKGENTAAVFEINKEKNIPFVDPSLFGDPKSGSMEPQQVTLAEAVNRWLVYLGVAERIETHDKGKMGHELKITTDIEEMEQDLTHVGVGVSQVLPILVMALLAEEDDVIILEQPELHLHPRVQSRLADFFVTMNALGKQCIVETHSEYLINRLRYLVAKSDDRKIADDTLIYFVEKEAGHSVYREITINEYGKIDEWPKGFFDEGENLASLTFKAAMEKKRLRKQQEGK